jgi:curved DNA-binding protein CbpA
MARQNHYETLGLRSSASEKEIKAAYRKIVLRHHPDRSSDPASTRIFMEATEAYEALLDPERRRAYDQGLAGEARRAAEREAEAKRAQAAESRAKAARAASTAPPPRTATAPPGTPIPTQLARLSLLFSRGLYAEAERLADEILEREPRQPLPYAVKGDLARQRGKLQEAARQYALAIQMDPRNPTYLQRYEEVLGRVQTAPDGRPRMEPSDRLTLAMLAYGAVCLLAAIFIVLSPEKPVFGGLGIVASWTVGLVAMLFLCGVAAGASLSVGDGLDRLDAYATGRIGPTVALGLVSIVSFPAAAVLYFLLGVAQRGFNLSTTRLMSAIGAAVATLAGGAALGHSINPVSVLLWGGNLAYLGGLCGWAVADSLRRTM